MEIVKIILACIGAYTVVAWVWDWFGFDRSYHPWPKVVPEENEKPLSIPERRVKRFELLQVVADLYAGKDVVLRRGDVQNAKDVYEELLKRVPADDILLTNFFTSTRIHASELYRETINYNGIVLKLRTKDCDKFRHNKTIK